MNEILLVGKKIMLQITYTDQIQTDRQTGEEGNWFENMALELFVEVQFFYLTIKDI